jgi:hypothetical protein
MNLWRRLQAYAGNDDPVVAAGNAVALVVASNQPFYPLYLYWLIGDGFALSFFTFLSTPFFIAVPALARRNSRAGRALLPLTGIANTVLCAKLFGIESGVEFFLAPCVVLAGLLFRPRERIIMLALAGLGIAAFLGLHDRYGAPAYPYSAAQYATLLRLNVTSVLTLLAFIGLSFANAFAAAPKS